MHVTACVAGQEEVDVEVGEACRSLRALKEAIVEALPKLCAEGFDVSVGGRALDDDEGVVSLEDSMRLDVVPNARIRSVLALREAGREVSEAGLLAAAKGGDVASCTLYLDAGVPLDCVDDDDNTPLHLSCCGGHLEVATLLLDRGSTAIDEKNTEDDPPLHLACWEGHLEVATLLLDRGSTAIDEKSWEGNTPLLLACWGGHVQVATLLLDRGSNALDEKNVDDNTPLLLACCFGHVQVATLLLDRGSNAIDEKDRYGNTPLFLASLKGYLQVAALLLDRGSCSVDVEKCRAGCPYPQDVVDLLSATQARS